MAECSKREVKYIRGKVPGLEKRQFRKDTFSPTAMCKILDQLDGIYDKEVINEKEVLYVTEKISDNYIDVSELLTEKHRDIIGKLSVHSRHNFLSFLVLLIYMDWLNKWIASELVDEL